MNIDLRDPSYNAIGTSFNPNDGGGTLVVARPCEVCGDQWQRRIVDEGFGPQPSNDMGGARYFVFGRWLCVTCMIGPIEDAIRFPK